MIESSFGVGSVSGQRVLSVTIPCVPVEIEGLLRRLAAALSFGDKVEPDRESNA